MSTSWRERSSSVCPSRRRVGLAEPIEEFRSAIDEILKRSKGTSHFVAAGAEEGEPSFEVAPDSAGLHNFRSAADGGRKIPVERLVTLVAPGSALRADLRWATEG